MKTPIRFSQDLFDVICDKIASGRSLRSICDDEGMPTVSGVMKWLSDKPEIVEQYTRAREIQAETIFDELLDIVDDASNDWMLSNKPDSASWSVNGEHISRSRLRWDARRWHLSKMIPKKYGDKTHTDITSNGNTIAVPPIKWADE